MTNKELRQIIADAEAIEAQVIAGIDNMNGDGLSRLYVKLAGYYSAVCGHHEQIKSDYITMWNAIRPHYKSDKACDMFLLHSNESAKLYDILKYRLKGFDKLLNAISSRLFELNQQAKNQT